MRVLLSVLLVFVVVLRCGGGACIASAEEVDQDWLNLVEEEEEEEEGSFDNVEDEELLLFDDEEEEEEDEDEEGAGIFGYNRANQRVQQPVQANPAPGPQWRHQVRSDAMGHIKQQRSDLDKARTVNSLQLAGNNVKRAGAFVNVLNPNRDARRDQLQQTHENLKKAKADLRARRKGGDEVELRDQYEKRMSDAPIAPGHSTVAQIPPMPDSLKVKVLNPLIYGSEKKQARGWGVINKTGRDTMANDAMLKATNQPVGTTQGQFQQLQQDANREMKKNLDANESLSNRRAFMVRAGGVKRALNPFQSHEKRMHDYGESKRIANVIRAQGRYGRDALQQDMDHANQQFNNQIAHAPPFEDDEEEEDEWFLDEDENDEDEEEEEDV